MQRFIAGIVLAACLAGCANGNPKVIAHRDPAFFPSATNTVAIATHQQPRPADAVLGESLKMELARRGFTLTAAEAADYVLAYWVEDNWNTIRPSGGVYYGLTDYPVGVPTYDGSPVTAPGSLTAGVSPDGRLERYLVTEGIRLELYPRSKSGNASLSPAWTGYIEGGSQLKTNRTPALLHTLLEYFGKDFTGRAKPGE
jgi:hypothetical protein